MCAASLGRTAWTASFISNGLTIIVACSITYVALKCVDLGMGLWQKRLAAAEDRVLDMQLFPVIQKSLKVFIVVVAALVTTQNLGMNVTGLLASLSIGGLAVGLVAQDTLSNLFSQGDVVSLHCPLTPETKHLVNAQRLARMKPTAFLLNTSRGPLIDEAALAEALNSGRIAGAALDVLSAEPPPADNPLQTAKNCLITPHNAWAMRGARALDEDDGGECARLPRRHASERGGREVGGGTAISGPRAVPGSQRLRSLRTSLATAPAARGRSGSREMAGLVPSTQPWCRRRSRSAMLRTRRWRTSHL